MINLSIIGLGKWGLELVKSVNKDSKVVRFNSVISRNQKELKKKQKNINFQFIKTITIYLKYKN